MTMQSDIYSGSIRELRGRHTTRSWKLILDYCQIILCKLMISFSHDPVSKCVINSTYFVTMRHQEVRDLFWRYPGYGFGQGCLLLGLSRWKYRNSDSFVRIPQNIAIFKIRFLAGCNKFTIQRGPASYELFIEWGHVYFIIYLLGFPPPPPLLVLLEKI